MSISRLACSALTIWIALGPLSGCGPSSSGAPVDAAVDAHAPDAATPDARIWPDGYVPPDAAPPECGNGVVEPGEACDDGNTVSGDGCNSTCTLNDEWDYVATEATAGDQREPTLSCDATSVALVFSDWSGLDGDGAAVRLRLFGPDGVPVQNAQGTDAEITVNQTTAGHQSQPRIARLVDGSFVVVWRDESGAMGAGPDVRGRMLRPDGAFAGGEFLLTAVHDGEQATPVVAAAPDGGFLAVWVGPDADGFGIWARRYDAHGAPQTNGVTGDDGAFEVNQITAGVQFQPDVAWLGDRYLVVWADASGQLDADSYGVVAELRSETGEPLGAGTDFLINSTTAGLQAAPRIAVQPGLGAAIAWADGSHTDDPSHYGIRARLVATDGTFRANGITVTDEDFPVNTSTEAGQQLPVVTSQDDGHLLLVWQDGSTADGSSSSVRGRVLSAAAGTQISPLSTSGDDFPINTTFWGAQLRPTACATQGWFVAAWEDESAQAPDEDGAAIRLRLIPGP